MRLVLSRLSLVLLIASATAVATGRTFEATRLPRTGDWNDRPFAAGTAELQVLEYDSGPWYYNPYDDFAGAQWACRFTPTAPCSLVAIEIATYAGDYGWNTGSLGISIHENDAGLPGTRIGGPYSLIPNADLSMQIATLPNPIDVGMRDFHIVITLSSDYAAHPTTDGDGGVGRTTYRPDTLSTWESVANQDLVLRAYVETYSGDPSGPSIVHVPMTTAFSYGSDVKVAAVISDDSAAEGILHYSINGAQYQSSVMDAVDSVYSAVLPGLIAGDVVHYYIEARELIEKANVSYWPIGGIAAPQQFFVKSGMELVNDDGIPDSYFIQSEIPNGNAFAVLMTPYMYPARITHLRVLVEDTTAFSLAIHSAATGVPGNVIYGPVMLKAATGPGWAELSLPEAFQPTVTVGHFFVVLKWMINSPTKPRVGTDLSQKKGRSYWGNNSFGWNSFTMGEFMIRAVVDVPTGVFEDESESRPTTMTLHPNYPNPFNAGTMIAIELARTEHVTLTVRDVLGRAVRHLQDGTLDAGHYTIRWDGKDDQGRAVATGVYFSFLQSASSTTSRKMMMLK